ncbi:MAG: sigma-54-dependent Fis family transcriptional regulator [Calditrichia bacterium]|nr:sigma-54-dependent Fis family transcriptional regulator [Calditrichia bacterium]
MAHILVVDNEERMCKIIQAALEMANNTCKISFSGKSALEHLENESFDLVITDLKMNDVDGMQVLKKAKEYKNPPEVILITAFASQQTAIDAMRLGAYDYLIKPFEMDELVLRVDKIMQHRQLEKDYHKLKQETDIQQIPNIIGKSKKMREVYNLIVKVSEKDATVLITGESGTGKELVAEAIHLKSERAKNQFVTINCAALPENLLESELFGFEKGAFTGATQKKIGLFEVANNGTIFLDEIGDMPLGIQAKLLRVLQNKEIVRIGGIEKIEINARVITATNKNLEKQIEENNFRSDLFYRINIFPIELPPLRERKEDIPELIQHFLGKFGNKGITNSAKKILMEYNWPGNVRELVNIIERSSIIADVTIDNEHLPKNIKGEKEENNIYDIPDEGINLEDVEKNLILSAIKKADGNKSNAADLLGITRRKLYSMMERFGLEVKSK